MTNERQDEFERRTKAVFDRSVAELDGATRSRLARARQRALAEALQPRSRLWSFGRPAQAAAALAIVAVFAAVLIVRDGPAPAPAVAVAEDFSDFDLLLEEDEFDLFEDLEFYAWLDEATDGAG
jgi:hypothetical protein